MSHHEDEQSRGSGRTPSSIEARLDVHEHEHQLEQAIFVLEKAMQSPRALDERRADRVVLSRDAARLVASVLSSMRGESGGTIVHRDPAPQLPLPKKPSAVSGRVPAGLRQDDV